MAEFPPNLDDGELWLPSDIFLGDVTSNYHNPHRIEAPDDLAQHLAAFSLFQHRAESPPSPNFQLFRPPVQYGSVDPVLAAELYRAGSGFNVGRGMVYSKRSVPLYSSSNLVKPTQPQVERFLEARARVLQRQQNRLHSRLMPFQARIGVGVGGFARESGGTGVFLPRVVNNTSTTNIDFGKKQGPKNRREVEVAQQRHSMKRAGVDKLEEHYCQFSSSKEIVLPQDWTY